MRNEGPNAKTYQSCGDTTGKGMQRHLQKNPFKPGGEVVVLLPLHGHLGSRFLFFGYIKELCILPREMTPIQRQLNHIWKLYRFASTVPPCPNYASSVCTFEAQDHFEAHLTSLKGKDASCEQSIQTLECEGKFARANPTTVTGKCCRHIRRGVHHITLILTY